MSDSTHDKINSLCQELEKDPSSDSFVELAKYKVENGDFEQAVDLCEKGLVFHEDHTEGYLVRLLSASLLDTHRGALVGITV